MQGHLIINHHITLRKDDNMSILNLFSLEGKNAIVIGACGGLGKGIATGLAEAGASVFVAGRKKEKCDHAASSIAEDTGGTAYGLPVDITIQDSIDEMIAKAEERAGKIHILVNSAGINIRKPGLGHRPGYPVKRQFFYLSGSGASHDKKQHTRQDYQYCLRQFKDRGKAGYCILRLRKSRHHADDKSAGRRMGAIWNPGQRDCSRLL